MPELSNPQPSIFWDYDGTIGQRIRFQIQFKGGTPTGQENNNLRYGLEDTLQRLNDQGFAHALTTSGSQEFSVYSLELAGIRHFFSSVQGGENTTSSGKRGKLYTTTAKEMGLTPENASRYAIIVGDNIDGDFSADLPNIVFLSLPGRLDLSAEVIEAIIAYLLEKGEGNFYEGFLRCYDEAVPRYPDKVEKHQWKTIALDSLGISFMLAKDEVRVDESTTIIVPTIHAVEAPTYRRNPKNI